MMSAAARIERARAAMEHVAEQSKTMTEDEAIVEMYLVAKAVQRTLNTRATAILEDRAKTRRAT